MDKDFAKWYHANKLSDKKFVSQQNMYSFYYPTYELMKDLENK